MQSYARWGGVGEGFREEIEVRPLSNRRRGGPKRKEREREREKRKKEMRRGKR